MAETKKEKHWLRKIQIVMIDGSLTVAAVISMVFGIYYVFAGDPVMSGTCMASGLALAFAATLSRFELLEAFGVKAKMRILDETIGRAAEELVQIKSLTELTTKALVQSFNTMGRWDGAPTVDQAYELARGVIRALTYVGSSDAEIRSILRPWMTTASFDLAQVALHRYDKQLSTITAQVASELKVQVPGTVSPSEKILHASIQKRLDMLTVHSQRRRELFQNLSIDDIPEKLTTLIRETPEISEVMRTEMVNALAPYITEIQFLAANMDFKNIDFWRKHSALPV